MQQLFTEQFLPYKRMYLQINTYFYNMTYNQIFLLFFSIANHLLLVHHRTTALASQIRTISCEYMYFLFSPIRLIAIIRFLYVRGSFFPYAPSTGLSDLRSVLYRGSSQNSFPLHVAFLACGETRAGLDYV